MDPSRLRERLREIVRPASGSAQRPSVGAGPGLGAPPDSSLETLLGGEWRESNGGGSFVVTRWIDPDAGYGPSSVRDVSAGLLSGGFPASVMAGKPARLPLLFFDLETSGLSGGAGTYAFLIGLGGFEAGGAFVTEQHLMIDYASERSILHVVGAALGRAGALVTFNGKSFDVPVLDTRYLFHRMEAPSATLPHVDLLHPARRFWGGTKELGCSLIALEQQVLGVERTGDVPGFEIPARYFQFVRTGDPRPLAGVLEHNRLDLLSLACLTARLFHLVEKGASGVRNAREALALGHLYERANLGDRAEDAFERAVALDGDSFSSVRLEALRALAIAARRRKRFTLAARRWRQVLETPHCPRYMVRAAIEALAIHHEHRVRDLMEARWFALRGLEIDEEAAGGDAARHRLARIERKLVSERPLFPSSTSRPSSGSQKSARQTSS